MKLEYRRARGQVLKPELCQKTKMTVFFWEERRTWIFPNNPQCFCCNRKIHPFYSFFFFNQNELVWYCCFLTWRITLVVDESHSNDTQLIFSLTHSCQNKQKPDLAFLKMSQIFSCNREFCWEHSRKSKHLYFFLWSRKD